MMKVNIGDRMAARDPVHNPRSGVWVQKPRETGDKNVEGGGTAANENIVTSPEKHMEENQAQTQAQNTNPNSAKSADDMVAEHLMKTLDQINASSKRCAEAADAVKAEAAAFAEAAKKAGFKVPEMKVRSRTGVIATSGAIGAAVGGIAGGLGAAFIPAERPRKLVIGGAAAGGAVVGGAAGAGIGLWIAPPKAE